MMQEAEYRGWTTDPESETPLIAWLIVATVIVTLASFVILLVVRQEHDNPPITNESIACTSDAINRAAETGTFDAGACDTPIPWYAVHPFWYALAIGGAVLIVGRLSIFIRRLESGRGG